MQSSPTNSPEHLPVWREFVTAELAEFLVGEIDFTEFGDSETYRLLELEPSIPRPMLHFVGVKDKSQKIIIEVGAGVLFNPDARRYWIPRTDEQREQLVKEGYAPVLSYIAIQSPQTHSSAEVQT